MGWHTNSNNPGTRIYLTYTLEAKKSFFDYVDQGEIIETADDEGWSCRRFHVSKEDLLWHRVRSETDRISVGFYGN